MQDLPGTTSRRRSRPVSRRDALRYATAVSALAGLDAASVGFGTPTAAAAAPQLIDFAARQIPAQHIRAAGYSGVVNYVSLSRDVNNVTAVNGVAHAGRVRFGSALFSSPGVGLGR